jgi:hypothetical protein
MLISKAFNKRKVWFLKNSWKRRPSSGLFFKNPLKARGLHPMNNNPRKTKCWPLKHMEKLMQGWPLKKHRSKIKVISEKDLKWRPSSGLSAKIHSKLWGYFSAPNELQGSTVQNADLWSMKLRQNTKFRGMIAEEDSKRSFLPDHSEFGSSDPTGLFPRHFLLKSKTTSWT